MQPFRQRPNHANMPSKTVPIRQLRNVSGGVKRPRSPEFPDVFSNTSQKRVRATPLPLPHQAQSQTQHPPLQRRNTVPATRDVQKEQKQAERIQKAAEFKEKYTKAFPSWSFYFDSENVTNGVEYLLKNKIGELGGTIEIFFSASVTHFITDKPIPTDLNPDKENQNLFSKPTSSKSLHVLKSPIKINHREDQASSSIIKALQYGLKIWTSVKLESVLSRCLTPDNPPPTPAKHLPILNPPPVPRKPPLSAAQRSLSQLLRNEKIHGTSERDPTQKRLAYRYFSKGSFFVLLEDIRQELATIAVHEYPAPVPVSIKHADKDGSIDNDCKEKEKELKVAWPVLHCHPLARNPFVPFDEKERKRYEKAQAQEKDKENQLHEEKDEATARHERTKRRLQLQAMKRTENFRQNDLAFGGNLRRVASTNSLLRDVRRLAHAAPIDLNDSDNIFESNGKCGHNFESAMVPNQAYVAASGNSVNITSATGTTSTSSRALRMMPLPNTITGRIKHEVVTSRKFPVKTNWNDDKNVGTTTGTVMGPPEKVPARPPHPVLRKSKSTNTMKLPKREEGVKPGYCESCRIKFSDFTTHTESSKHRKFGQNSSNFEALDHVLHHLQRWTHREVREREQKRTEEFIEKCKLNPHPR